MKEEAIIYLSGLIVCASIAAVFLLVHFLLKRRSVSQFDVDHKLGIWEFTKKNFFIFMFWCFLALTIIFLFMLIPKIN